MSSWVEYAEAVGRLEKNSSRMSKPCLFVLNFCGLQEFCGAKALHLAAAANQLRALDFLVSRKKDLLCGEGLIWVKSLRGVLFLCLSVPFSGPEAVEFMSAGHARRKSILWKGERTRP